jgi:hypothetical protein
MMKREKEGKKQCLKPFEKNDEEIAQLRLLTCSTISQ